MAGAAPARKVLRNPAVDFAVLETARGGILHAGLGFAHCDVAVVTNVAADHLGLGGIATVADMARLKAVVPRAVAPGGASILNADDPSTVEMATVACGEVLFFSLNAASPVVAQHVVAGGRAVVLVQTPSGEMLRVRTEREDTELLRVEEIPATLQGRIRVNIANALAATAAAIAQHVPYETIRTALRTYTTAFLQNPGRFNLLEIDGRTVVLDYCHNLHGLEAMADFVRRMDAPHTVGVIAFPGDRSDEHVAAFGQLAAQIFDELVITETAAKYLRGRKEREVPTLLQAAALDGGLPPDKITLAHNQPEATDVAMTKSGEGSLIVVTFVNVDETWRHLMQRQHARAIV